MGPLLGTVPALAVILLAAGDRTLCGRTLQVCLSPGCVADGARATLDRLAALAPPGCRVEPGACVSGCGAGPIVLEKVSEATGGGRVVHKRVGGAEAMMRLLVGAGDEAPSPDLVLGYDAVVGAEIAASEGRHSEAAGMYGSGIALAIAAIEGLGDGGAEGAVEAANCRLRLAPSWLIRAQIGEARAMLAVKDAEGAVRAALSSIKFSCESDPLCYEVMAEASAAAKDAAGELEALRSMFALPEEPDMPRDVANRRRTWGFRLARLERETAKS